jgi:predicted metalloprotease with PDZ domain
MIAPLPVSTGEVKWRAETRGSIVLLLVDPKAPIKNWKGQLGIIFTHELLHLWAPNALALQGDYDWFFEGFTLYTALVTALKLKLIDFQEYVATLERVYDSYLAQADGLSLIDASERRWTSGNSLVYDKGMLVAFLYDLAISQESGGKKHLADRYRELFGRSATAAGDGNEVIIRLLSSTPATAALARRYIEGAEELDLKAVFANQKQISKSLGYH